VIALKYQRPNLKCRCKIHSKLPPSTHNCKNIRLHVKTEK